MFGTILKNTLENLEKKLEVIFREALGRCFFKKTL